jgi:23S rRNA G2445 N2-methylase RlmL
VPKILALDADPERIPAMVGNLRAAGLTGPASKDAIVIAQCDVRGLTPDYLERMLPAARSMKPGVFCFNPPYGVRIGAEQGEKKLLALYSDMGRAFARFSGWRAACFVANPHFVGAFGHSPIMTKPASNADLPGAFLVFQL